ncbi:MAG: FAD-dependent oxidoreductase [Candidatus Saccharibacteria bacterium]
MIYDTIIIGGGPAGMTAGIYAARKKLKTLILTKDIGGQTAWSSDVENYPGFTMITGAELVERFEQHVEKFKDFVELRLVTKGVSAITKSDKLFTVSIEGHKSEKSKTVIIAGGKVPRFLGLEGEKKYLNKGVSYCSWCDGPIFSGKDIAIIGGGNSALDATINLSKIVKSIVIINITKELTGDPVLVDKVTTAHNVRILNDSEALSINGDKFVSSVTLRNHVDKKPITIDVEGVFIEAGSLPATSYLENFVKLNRQGEIRIDKNNMTSVKGIFAAGDITQIEEKQIIVASAEGAKAAICASKYLARL